MSKYEIELRGLLKPRAKNKLCKFLRKNGKFIKKYTRTQWCFNRSLKKKIDLRIKETNGQWEFSLKAGGLGEFHRKEIYLSISKNKTKQAFEFLKVLGYRDGIKAIRNAEIYFYKEIEWAIVEVPNHSWYFEAEKLVDNKKDGYKAEEEIRKICDQLKLTIYTPKQTIDYIARLDREANKHFKL